MQHVFGELAPDLGSFIGDSLQTARNVFPNINGYEPALGLLAQSVGALPLPCRGLWFVQKSDGSYDSYAATRAKIYRYNADTQDFDDVSRLVGGDYGLPTDDYWSGAQFGSQLILVQLGDVPQVIDIDIGTNFDALGGSPPIARFVTTADNKLTLACLVDNRRMIQWSDVNDSTVWSGGLAGNQEFVDHGAVMGFFPHARIVLLERGMHEIVSTSDIYSYNFPELTNEKGTTAPYACIELGTRLYYLSVDGFYVVNASSDPVNISDNRVTQYFYSILNNDRHFQVFGAFDPFHPRLIWTFPTSDTEYNDRALVFDYSLTSTIGVYGRWSELSFNSYVLARLATAAVSLEGGGDPSSLDDPGLPSLDSAIYMAGAPELIVVGTDNKLSALNGPSLEARLKTGTFNLAESYRAKVRAVMPFVEGTEADQITVNVGKRRKTSDDYSWSGAIPQQASGWHRFNADGLFHEVEFVMPTAKAWTKALGWSADFGPTSGR